jgi:hypothetical protein
MGANTWHDAFVACASAGAALAGLIFVAVSLNVKTMLAIPSMPSRAATTIASLTLTVVVGCTALMPMSTRAVGAISLAATALVLALSIRSAALIMRDRGARSMADALSKGLLGAVPPTLTIIGCVFLTAGSPAGFAIIGLSFLLIFAASMTNAWVVLVEILR